MAMMILIPVFSGIKIIKALKIAKKVKVAKYGFKIADKTQKKIRKSKAPHSKTWNLLKKQSMCGWIHYRYIIYGIGKRVQTTCAANLAKKRWKDLKIIDEIDVTIQGARRDPIRLTEWDRVEKHSNCNWLSASFKNETMFQKQQYLLKTVHVSRKPVKRVSKSLEKSQYTEKDISRLSWMLFDECHHKWPKIHCFLMLRLFTMKH